VSGEIDLIETRGNQQLFSGSVNVGAQQSSTTLHFGPKPSVDGWRTAHFKKNSPDGFDKDFHIYRMFWSPRGIDFFIDNSLVGLFDADDGFFKRGKFDPTLHENPWANDTIMAPFDQEFYIIMNTAVGGISFFSDSFKNIPYDKPVS
jgi:hypothetical protein